MMVDENLPFNLKEIALDLQDKNENFFVEFIKLDYFEKISDMDTRYLITINKLQGLKLKKYNRVVFLDADCLIIKNIDYVFESDLPYLVIKSPRIEQKLDWCPYGVVYMLFPADIDYSLDVLSQRDKFSDDEPLVKEILLNKYGDVTPDKSFILDCILHFPNQQLYSYYDFNSWEDCKYFVDMVVELR